MNKTNELINSISIKNKTFHWLYQGDSCISSRAMACAICDIDPDRDWIPVSHPIGADNLIRCAGYLDAVPEARSQLSKAANINKAWALVIKHWKELETMLAQELKTGNAAPRTQKRLLDILEKNNEILI